MNADKAIVDKDDFEPQGHFIAYFDILGYEHKIKEVGGASKLAEIINKNILLAQDIASIFNGSEHIRAKEINFKLKAFSDNFILCSENDFLSVLFISTVLQGRLITDNIFVKGALCYGDLYFGKEFVCGEGLIHAYKIESEIAIFPRIIVDDSFSIAAVDEVKKSTSDRSDLRLQYAKNSDMERLDLSFQEIGLEAFSTDFDGYTFIDYLKTWHSFYYMPPTGKTLHPYQEAVARLANEQPLDEGLLELFSVLCQHQRYVEKNLVDYRDQRRVLQKYQWCKKYHNNFCRQYNYPDVATIK